MSNSANNNTLWTHYCPAVNDNWTTEQDTCKHCGKTRHTPSDTPRTDEIEQRFGSRDWETMLYHALDLCRTLERELARTHGDNEEDTNL